MRILKERLLNRLAKWPDGVSPLLLLCGSLEDTVEALEQLRVENLVEWVPGLAAGVAYRLKTQ
jgi:hypothetical protein